MKKAPSVLIPLAFTILFAGSTAAAPRITPNLVYGHKDGMALIYDMVTPENANGAGIIYMMSGGWFSRYRDPERLSRWFQPLLAEGYTLFAVYHGSAPRYKVPEAYADVSRAVRHIKRHAREYGVDANRLGVTGGSAGGHLALMVGLNPDRGDASSEDEVMRTDNRVAAVVAYYPPVDIRQSVGSSLQRFPALDFDSELAPGVSPILFVSEDDPPTLLIHGDKDTLVSDTNSKRIHKALAAKNVETDMLIIRGAGHGFREPAHVKAASEARTHWFDKYLNPEKDG